MLAVHFLGSGRISLDELPEPEPKGQWVLVKVKAAAICGTDRENLEGGGQLTVPGHESAGQVIAVDKTFRLKIGDRVVINPHITCGYCEHCLRGDLYFCENLSIIGFDIDGGFAEYVLVPEPCCMFLPDDISFEVGSLLVDMLGTAYHGVKRAGVLPGNHVAVWGAGPVGLSTLLVASYLSTEVAVVEPNTYRQGLARSLGASLVLNPVVENVRQILMDWTKGRGVDVAFECVGSEEAATQALAVVGRRGKLAFIGVSKHFSFNPWVDLMQRELIMYGSRSFVLPEFDEMVAIVRRGLPVERIITHRFPLREAEAAFDIFRSGQCGKVLFLP
jgi:propanol-preferring alcohol dehydrogenase